MENEFIERLRVAMGRLYSGLRAGRQEFEVDAQSGSIVSLQAVTQFVQSVADFDDRGLTMPLVSLLAGMNDLKRGSVPPILQPIAKNGRKPNNSLFDPIRAAAVLCTDIMVDSGYSADKACEVVARCLQQHDVLKGRRDTTGAIVVKGWRQNKSRWEVGGLAKSVYDSLQNELVHVTFESPESAWKALEPMLLGVTKAFKPALN